MCNPNQSSEVGWIRLYRKITEWRWYGAPNMMAVFIHLLLSANHKDGYCYGFEVKREVIPLLLPAAKAYACVMKARGTPKEYIKHLQTWINNRCWETDYQSELNSNNGNIRPYQSNGIS